MAETGDSDFSEAITARYNIFDAAYATETTMENDNIKGFAEVNSRPLVLNKRPYRSCHGKNTR
jgi:hypothetical protein